MKLSQIFTSGLKQEMSVEMRTVLQGVEALIDKGALTVLTGLLVQAGMSPTEAASAALTSLTSVENMMAAHIMPAAVAAAKPTLPPPANSPVPPLKTASQQQGAAGTSQPAQPPAIPPVPPASSVPPAASAPGTQPPPTPSP